MECNDKEMQREKQRTKADGERQSERGREREAAENGEYEMQSNGFKFFINT